MRLLAAIFAPVLGAFNAVLAAPGALLGVLSVAVLVSGQANAATLAVVGGTIIDGNGGVPIKNGVILIENGKITAIGPESEIPVPKAARQIQAGGKYIIPGLMDANVHLAGVYSVESVLVNEERLHDTVLESAQLLLKSGITTAFESWGPLPALKEVRDEINRGDSVGTRMFIAGNIVGFTGIFGADFNAEASKVVADTTLRRINDIWEQGVGRELLYMTPEEVRARMREYLSKDIDFIKYGVNEHGGPFIAFSPRVQKVLVEEAHRAGKTIQTHTMSVEGVDLAIEAGVDLLQHCDVTGPIPLPEETIRTLVARRIPCAVLAYTADNVQDNRGWSAGRRMDRSVMDINVRSLLKAGANLVLSTDFSIRDPAMKLSEISLKIASARDSPTQDGEAHFLWLKAMDEKGMDPMKNLQAATRNIAAAYHVLDYLGTLERGKFADLVILDANPLESVGNYRKIARVIKGGEEVDGPLLPLRPVLSNKEGSPKGVSKH